MRKVRVLVVDDSTVIRRVLTDCINGDPALEVAATAPNGRIALAKIPQINPDVITLDLEMPELDGLGTLVELRKTWPRLPVIVFSTLSTRGAVATLDALSLGANDYVAKPSNVGSMAASMAAVRSEMLPKIKAFCPWAVARPAADAPTRRAASKVPVATPAAARAARIDLVAIGVSTGGPAALIELLSGLPASFPVPVVVVQHMPPIFTKHLAQRLDQASPLRVSEAAPGDVLEPGGVWVAPGDYHLTLRRHGLKTVCDTTQTPHVNSCRPAVDVLFRSAAELYGPRMLALVMTGMGSDGRRGCEFVREAGGSVLAQDEASSVVWGMPGAVTNAGLADAVLPLEQLPQALLREAARGRAAVTLAPVGG